jgi:hypothetical protein
MSGCEYSNSGLLGYSSANRTVFLGLKEAKQFGLKRERYFADLVEKYSSAERLFDDSGSVTFRAGKRSPGRSKQFALPEGLGDGGTIDGDEGLPRAITRGMNGTRHEFFPAARFSSN